MLSTKKLRPLQALLMLLIIGVAFALDQLFPGASQVATANLDPSAVVIGVIVVGGVVLVIRGDGTVTRKDDNGPIE